MIKKRKWIIVIPAILAFAAIMAALAVHYGITLSLRPPNRYKGNIEAVKSTVDRDGDGIDDQTDILQGALGYIKTRPKYKSAYYATGFPDDGYGVCSDVVVYGMLNAGYNLMELVRDDVAQNPEDYDIDKPDPNIDFRRVRNLNVYFQHTALELTTDVSKIEEWQGGDIVVFKKHIGIVSDRRNRHGVPYLIHHSGRVQLAYEEDFLENNENIIGHYRVSQ